MFCDAWIDSTCYNYNHPESYSVRASITIIMVKSIATHIHNKYYII